MMEMTKIIKAFGCLSFALLIFGAPLALGYMMGKGLYNDNYIFALLSGVMVIEGTWFMIFLYDHS